jgi:hypothetical protein
MSGIQKRPEGVLTVRAESATSLYCKQLTKSCACCANVVAAVRDCFTWIRQNAIQYVDVRND